MNKTFFLIILRRFGKGFIAGGIATTSVFIATQPLTDLSQLKPWLTMLGVSFLSGGLLAVEKLLQGYHPQ